MSPEFVTICDPIDVTSMDRTNTAWRFTDKAGHEHCWYDGDEPAGFYSPMRKYHLPTLRWVVDGIGYYPDGSEYEQGHYECRECGDHARPGRTSDSHRQHIPGPIRYEIDGQEVSREEHGRRLAIEMEKKKE